MIPKGYRVVSIRVDAVSGGGNLLLPGCRVDLLVHMAKNVNLGIRETTTRTILQDIKVFAVNNVVAMDANGPETKSIQARTVSLLVTPAQAEKVTLATELGSIKLVMRGPEEETEVQTEGALPRELFGDSDKANRGKEEATQPTGLNNLKEQGKGFLEYLNALREKANVEKPAPPEPAQETWSVRILAGADVNEVTLRGPASTGPDAGYWTLSSGRAAGNNGGKNTLEIKVPPPPAEEKQPAKTGILPGDDGLGGRGNQAGQPGGGPSSGPAPS